MYNRKDIYELLDRKIGIILTLISIAIGIIIAGFIGIGIAIFENVKEIAEPIANRTATQISEKAVNAVDSIIILKINEADSMLNIVKKIYTEVWQFRSKMIKEYRQDIIVDSAQIQVAKDVSDLIKSIDTYEEITGSKSPTDSYNKGILLMQKGEMENAILSFQEAIKLDPNYKFPYAALGGLFENVKRDHEKAIEYFKKALEIDSTFDNAWMNLGIIYRNMEEFRIALAHLDKAVKYWPKGSKSGLVYFERAIVNHNLDKKEDVLKDLKEAVLIEPAFLGRIKDDKDLNIYYDQLKEYKNLPNPILPF